MKVLWVTTSDTFYYFEDKSINNSYNGVGWVASQQLKLMERRICDLAIMFPTSDFSAKKRVVDGVTYYPIVDTPGRLTKLARYYFPDKNDYYKRVSPQVFRTIDDFKPDIIHVFGLECPLSEIIFYSKLPCVVHLQGILSAYENSFFPPSIGIEEIKKNGSYLRERILRNGFLHGYDVMRRGALKERKLFKNYSYFFGRTQWDRDITKLYSRRDAKYFHVNEILRPEFYEAAVCEPRKEIDCLRIVSTISETLYKGLDMVMKTAKELENFGYPYRWTIIGVGKDTEYEHIVCKSLGIKVPDAIDFVGIKNAGEIVDILNEADVYFHPSYIDNSPNSLCEAQMVGIPVMATDVGGVSTIVEDKVTGILVPSNEPNMAASHLIELSENYNLRLNLSRSGRARAIQRHDPKKIIDDIVEVYYKLTSDEHL